MIIISVSLVSQVSATDVAVNNESINQNDEVLSVDESPVVSTDYTPSNGDDLQKCIDSAKDGDTIVLNGTYYLKNTVNIDKAISIVGTGDGATIKKDDFSFYKISYFNVTSSNVVLKNLRLIEGNVQYGGAIYWSGDNGSVINSHFEGNMAVNDGLGGAMMVVGNNFRVENTVFLNNRATKGTAGALSIHGDGAVVSNCLFDQNKVDNGSAGAVALFADNCLIEKCNFTYNFCSDFGGAVVAYGKSTKIANSLFRNNDAKTKSSNKGGGAIFSDCADLTVDNCTFNLNYARDAYGGAIFASKNSIIKNSNFNNNYALDGDDIYSSSSSNLVSNYFALDYNQTQEHAVHVAELKEFNNTYEVVKEDSSVIFTASMVFEYTSSGSIYVTVEGGSIERQNISVLGHKEAKITFKDNTLTVSNLAVGEYTLRVITTPDEAHNSVEKDLPITVKKATAVISASKKTVALKRGTKWSLKIINARTKKPIANMKVTLKIYTGKKYITKTVKTNSNGVATYQTKNLAKGNHKVVVSAKHDGYNFNTLTSSINVIKPTELTYKINSQTNDQGSLLSIMVYKKSTKKPINGVKVKLSIKKGKKTKTVVLRTTTKDGFVGVCGYGTNTLSVGTHKVVIEPVDIEFTGSATSKMTIKSSAKKYPNWTKKVTGKV